MTNYKKIHTNELRKKILKETKSSKKKFITNYKDIKRYLNILIIFYLKMSLIFLMILKLKK